MRVGFTGSRTGMSGQQRVTLRRLLDRFRETDPDEQTEFHHGDAIGADEQAASIAEALGLWIVSHPALDPTQRADSPADVRHRPRPALARNRLIVQSTDILIAAPDGPEKVRSGTWSTVRYAASTRRHRLIIAVNGDVDR